MLYFYLLCYDVVLLKFTYILCLRTKNNVARQLSFLHAVLHE